jgi:hypothetical protein
MPEVDKMSVENHLYQFKNCVLAFSLCRVTMVIGSFGPSHLYLYKMQIFDSDCAEGVGRSAS